MSREATSVTHVAIDACDVRNRVREAGVLLKLELPDIYGEIKGHSKMIHTTVLRLSLQLISFQSFTI